MEKKIIENATICSFVLTSILVLSIIFPLSSNIFTLSKSKTSPILETVGNDRVYIEEPFKNPHGFVYIEVENNIIITEPEVVTEVMEAEKSYAPAVINYAGRNIPSETSDLVWSIMTEEFGWENHIAAGILGNMMAEVGGQTLNLQHNLRTPGYYGLCMWSIKYFPVSEDMSIKEQMSLLFDTIDISIFDKINSPEEAAYSFAVNYERCSSASHNKRKENARIAFEVYGG